jgi:hypothetical protein
VFIKAIDGQTNKPVSGQTIICEHADGEATTNENGQAILYFRKFHGDTRLYTGDPKSKKVMYSTLLTVKRGRVLEVTLKLPFRSEKEAKEENEGGKRAIGFQLPHDTKSTPTLGQSSETNPYIDEENWVDTQGQHSLELDASGSCGGRDSAYIENVRAGLVSAKLTSRFDIIDKKEELCDLFGVSTDIPNISLELLEIKNTQLFENQEEVNYFKDQLDIGNDLDEEEKTLKVNRIIQMEAYIREIGDEMNTTIEQYQL